MQKVYGKKKRGIRIVGVICFWLCLWQAGALLADNSLLLAGPVETLLVFVREAATAVFWQTVLFSMCRIFTGFFLACLLGSLLGILSFRFPFWGELFSPFMLFCKAVPVASFAVLLLIWWGAEWLSVTVCFLVVLPVVYVSFLEGLKSCDRKLLEMAEVFKMPFYNRAFYLYRPALSPFVESCLKTSLGMGIKAGVAAEVIGIADRSIGGALYQSKIYLDTAGVFAWTATVVLLSFFTEKSALWLWHAFCKWKPVPGKATKRVKQAEKREFADIHLQGVSKAYGDSRVLSGVTKMLAAGRIYCLMAPSGSGKTTLLHIMAGTLKQDEGSFYAEQAGGKSVKQLRAAVVFQEDRLCEEETALRNAELVCGDSRRAKACLLLLLPKEALLKPVKELSGGMRRRVCLARAILAEAEVLLLDEPFNGLDEDNRKMAADLIKKYQNGRLVVTATHEPADVSLLDGEIWEI